MKPILAFLSFGLTTELEVGERKQILAASHRPPLPPDPPACRASGNSRRKRVTKKRKLVPMIKKLQAVPGREKAVMFELKRTDSNRDLWSVLYANKKFRMAAKPEACKDDTNDRIYVTAGLEDGTQLGPSTIACLEYFPNVWSTWLPPTGAVLLIGATLLLAWKTSMLRDPGVQPNGKRRRGA
jgi:hypothetical protein